MQTTFLSPFAPADPGRAYLPGLFAALAATIVVFAVYVAGGLATLDHARGDNDSLMRLVQVRDLVAGQGWFDLHQYRMGPEGGFVMHWSRLVDAPIAALLVAAHAATDAATAETVVLVLWPLLLFAVAACLLVAIARILAGDEAVMPAAVIGAGAFYFVGVFAPATLDHHNVQLVLVLAMLYALLRARDVPSAGYAAGAAAALMLAVGMEAAPFMAVGGAAVALAWLVAGEAERGAARRFGVGLALAALAAFAATVPPGRWAAAACDSFSLAQMLPAFVAGGGLALVSSSPAIGATPVRRAAALAGLALVTATLVAAAFPQCLADPYAGLDPRLQRYWLSAVTEAQSVADILPSKPAMAVAYYATPLLALVLLAVRAVRTGPRRADILVGSLLLAAFAVSLWQVRGSMFAVPLAAVALAAWVARRRAASRKGAAATLGLVAAWLVSVNIVWSTSAHGIATLVDGTPGRDEAETAERADCYGRSDFAALAALPPATVLASSNLGAGILRHTHHRVFAGPYHRNVAGNLIALDVFMGTAEAAQAIVREHDADYLAFCPGNAESSAIAKWAPDGTMAALVAGDPPAWLKPVDEDGSGPLEIYRLRPR